MTRVNCTTKFYAYISSAWVELNDAGAAGNVRGSWGMSGNSPLDRVADPGEIRVPLDNSGGLYTPGGPSALAGFKKGILVKMVCTYEGTDKEWYYYLDDIDIRPNNKDKKAYISCVTWMGHAQRHPITNPGIQTNQTGDQVLDTAIALADVAPRAIDFDTGVETFPTTFDTTTSHTTIYSEMAKVAFSEVGYVYERKDGTIVFDAQDARPGSRAVDKVPVDNASTGRMLKEDTDYLLLETGDKIILSQTEAVSMTSATIVDFDAPYGDHVINRMTVFAYPRRLSASPEVLFSLDKEIVIGSGQSYTLKGNYADPNGGLPINAQDVVTPVATTDYTMYTATGGGGSAITGSLTVSITKGTEGFTAVLTNENASKGYINFFRVRGTGIFQYNPIQHEASNTASIAEYEAESETIHQKYQNTTYTGRVFTDSVVEEHNQPRTVLNSIKFVANKSSGCMMAWLYGEVGQLHYIDIDELGLTGNYYIQGIEFQMNGKIITVTWIVVAALSISSGCGFTPIAVDFGGQTTQDAVNFGYLPNIADLPQRSYCAWLYSDSDGSELYGQTFLASWSDAAGYRLMLSSPGENIQLAQRGTGDYGAWRTQDSTAPLQTLIHVVVTRDSSSPANAPVFYINGVSQTVVTIIAQTTPTASEIGSQTRIGNNKAYNDDYFSTFNGKISDVRIYNRILTQTEVTEMYNSGTPSASAGPADGMLFQAFVVRTGDIASYIDQTLTNSTNLFDAQFKAVGVVNGSPIGRAAP